MGNYKFENESVGLNTWITFINRELFKFPAVLEFPNASNKIFASGSIPANDVDVIDESEKNFNKIFMFSDFPDPVTPEMIMDWGIP